MRTAVLALALLALVAGATAAEDAVRLLYHFEPDQTLDYEITLSGSGVTTVTPEGAKEPQQTVPMEMSGTMAMTQQVVQMYDDGSALLDMTVKNLEMDMTVREAGEPKRVNVKLTPDRLIVSGPEGSREMSLSEAGLGATPIGRPMRMRMSPRGEISAFSAEGLGQLASMTGMDFSEMMKPGETPFPERAVSPGDSWTYQMDIPSPTHDEKIEIGMEATLRSLEGDGPNRVATIGIEGDVDLSGMTMEAPGGAPSAQKLTFETLTEALTGEFAFDVQRGFVKQAAYDINLLTAMKVPAAEDQPPSVVRTEMNMTMNMELK